MKSVVLVQQFSVIFSLNVAEIYIISKDEKKQDWMKHTLQTQYPEYAGKVQFYVGDVRNIDFVRRLCMKRIMCFIRQYLKKVPSCEFFLTKAVRANIIGMDSVITVSMENKLEKVEFLSKGKAGYLINSMSMIKITEEFYIENVRNVQSIIKIYGTE